MNEDTPNFQYFAAYYLDVWFQWDKQFVNGLCSPDFNKRRTALGSAAKYYAVSRNFKIIAGETRFERALELIDEIRSAPGTDDEVVGVVVGLAAKFKKAYGRHAASAASKFLWLKFRNPIVIYDEQAYSCLSRIEGLKAPNWNYHEYIKRWRACYARYAASIQDACYDLYKFKRFTLGADMTDEAIKSLTQNPWFMERVLDTFLWLDGAPSKALPKGDEPTATPPQLRPAPSAEP